MTRLRAKYLAIKDKHPEVIERVSNLPARIKAAKASQVYRLIVFRRKALGLFIHAATDGPDGSEVNDLLFEDALRWIECDMSEPQLPLSDKFWANYELIKTYKPLYKASKSELSLEVKAMNNLQSAIRFYKSELHDKLPFIRTLIKDLREYHTLSKYSLRRLSAFDLKPDKPKELKRFEIELQYLLRTLGEDYLDIIKERISDNYHEIIIAVENNNH